VSSTRKSKNDFVFHQSRYASSPEFERGLIANLVARRCSVLDNPIDRELIWFLQYLSHQSGGLDGIANQLKINCPDLFQTKEMMNLGIKLDEVLNTAKVIKIRDGEFLTFLRDDYRRGGQFINEVLTKGEFIKSGYEISKVPSKPDWDQNCDLVALPDCCGKSGGRTETLPASLFFEVCRAQFSGDYLRGLCLDPSSTMDAGPWYSPNLIGALHKYKDAFAESKNETIFTTSLGKKVGEVLDYTVYCRGLTLVEGESRRGKSFAARNWCERQPGKARFVEVPPGNDDASFFRALARGLGLGNFLNYKVVQIRERVESVLLTCDMLLCLDEAQRLWPQSNLRYSQPGRINWIMTMANAGVPICMVSTPQFFVSQKAVEKTGWNSAQLTGRISHHENLPADLSAADLIGVAKSNLPSASPKILQMIATYARTSTRYLAAIDSIVKRAGYIAAQSRRDSATAEDVQRAMIDSVIPSDRKLLSVLEKTSKTKNSDPADTFSTSRDTPQQLPAEDNFPVRPRIGVEDATSKNRVGDIAHLVGA